MRKFLVLASVAAVALSSCNKTEPLTGGKDPEVKSVGFETYLGRTTKGVSKDAFKMGDQFSTFGVKTGGDNFDIATPAFTKYVFDNATNSAIVSHLGLDPQTGAPIWNYGDPAPWDEQKATFFAYSPVPQGVNTFGISNPFIADGVIPSIDFEVAGGFDPIIDDLNHADVSMAREKIKSQTDLLWAYAPDNTKASGTIQMEFRHALSQIRFSVRGYHNQGLLRINSITIANALTKGKLALANDIAFSGEMGYLGGWSNPTEPKNFAVNLQTEAVSAIPPHLDVAGTTPITWPITDDDESLMMIPQALAGLKLNIRYSYSDDGRVWNDYESGSAMDFVLSTLSSHWTPNKRYNYILSIYPGKAIKFTSTIDPWEPYADQADLEYRTFDIISAGGTIEKADGTAEIFALKEGDNITTTYTAGTNWLVATDKAGANHVLNGAAITVTAADAGQWKIASLANDNVTARTGTIVIERAPYDKTLADGAVVSVKSGVAKYVVKQTNGTALTASSVVYGGQNGTIVTGLDGYTLTSYSNVLSTTALAVEADIYTTEKPSRRVRIALADAGAASSLAAAIKACGAYNEAGAATGKWRVARASELKLFSLNKTAINTVTGLTALANAAYWSASLQDLATTAYWTMNFTDGTMAALVENGTNTALVRCVFEEK